MEQSINSQDLDLQEMKNTLRYMLYLSEPPDETTISRYKGYLSAKVETIDLNKMNLEISSKFCGLSGRHKFDQDIEDEWFIVYILYELSKFDEDVVIRVADEYGDLLLVEAADHLPRWLESKKSRNRTFIHKGALHIIPENINLKRLLGERSRTLREKAANFVRQVNKSHKDVDNQACPIKLLYQGDIPKDIKTLANEKIQRAIIDQLTGLPDKRAWLSKKFAQLDDIITDRSGASGRKDSERVQVEQDLEKNFKENLTLASIKAMDDKDLVISPMSSVTTSRSSSLASSSSSSTSWLSEDDEEEKQPESVAS